jgi:hypothetical protein
MKITRLFHGYSAHEEGSFEGVILLLQQFQKEGGAVDGVA